MNRLRWRRSSQLISSLVILTLLGIPPLQFASAEKESEKEDHFEEWTKESERSIKRGNIWLLQAFNDDGGCGIDIGQPSDISCSAMVGLAFLSQGSTAVEGPRRIEVRKIRDYLLDQIEAGRFANDLRSQVRADLSGYADHHFAALFLSQVHGHGESEERVKNGLSRLTKEIGESQHAQGHWGAGRYPRLGAVTGWCSLRGAHFAGINTKASTYTTAKYLITQMKMELGQRSGNLFATASGIRVLYSMGMENEKVAQDAFKRVIDMSEKEFPSFARFGGEQYLAFHYLNEVMIQKGGKDWKRWFPGVRDKLIKVQNRDGSWIGYSCITSRTFCTAAALLVLTSPNRYLPISTH